MLEMARVCPKTPAEVLVDRMFGRIEDAKKALEAVAQATRADLECIKHASTTLMRKVKGMKRLEERGLDEFGTP
jgi:hypothetical protein